MAPRKTNVTKAAEPANIAQEREKILLARLQNIGGKKNNFGRQNLRAGESFDLQKNPIYYIPTGIVEIDAILGEGGGIPEGTLIEICGKSQSGKSYAAMKLMANAQKVGKRKRVSLINAENSFYPPRARAVGMDLDDINTFELYENLGAAENYAKLVEDMVASREYDVITIDSLSALIPQANYDKEYDETRKIGAHAEFTGRMCGKLMNLCAETNTTVVLINQFRMASSGGGLGGMTQWVEKPTGGQALEYLTHMRLWINRINGTNGDVLDDDENVIGGKSKVKLYKTRYGAPLLESEFPILFYDAKVSPVGEFLYRAKAKRGQQEGYISYVRKVYVMMDEITGEQLGKSKDPKEFIFQLMQAPPPTDRPKNSKAENAFEFLCERLKMTPKQREVLINALDEEGTEDFDEPTDMATAAVPVKEVTDVADESMPYELDDEEDED